MGTCDAQTLPNGDTFVGWGALPYLSQFSRSGELVLSGQFPTGVNSYRAYRLPWSDGLGGHYTS